MNNFFQLFLAGIISALISSGINYVECSSLGNTNLFGQKFTCEKMNDETKETNRTETIK